MCAYAKTTLSAYNGSPQKLVRQTIQTEGLEIEYSFDCGVSVETGLPMKKASGEYLICYRVIGNETYETLDWSEPMLATIRMYATFSNPDFVLPPFLSEIGEEAFAEDTSITVVDAGGCAIIDAYAFGDCANLKRIRLPQDCEIDDTAFDGCEALRSDRTDEYVFALPGPSPRDRRALRHMRQSFLFLTNGYKDA